MMYIRRATGARPYNTKVTMAPSTVPVVLVASATAIIRVDVEPADGDQVHGGGLQEMLQCNMVDAILRDYPNNDTEAGDKQCILTRTGPPPRSSSSSPSGDGWTKACRPSAASAPRRPNRLHSAAVVRAREAGRVAAGLPEGSRRALEPRVVRRRSGRQALRLEPGAATRWPRSPPPPTCSTAARCSAWSRRPSPIPRPRPACASRSSSGWPPRRPATSWR
jgi:hypothetical protein